MEERRRDLAKFQAGLLELLAADAPLDEVIASLTRLGSATELPSWEGLDPRMVATAMELMGKWGVRATRPQDRDETSPHQEHEPQ